MGQRKGLAVILPRDRFIVCLVQKEFIKLAHALPDQIQTTILHSNLTKEESVWAKKLLDLCAKNSKKLIHRLEL